MTKILPLVMSLSLLAIASSANAGVTGLEVGGAAWVADSDVDASYLGSHDYGNTFNGYVWGSLEHFVPFVPNLKVRYTYIDDDKDGMDMDMSHADVIGYYNLLDVTPFTLKLGIGLKAGDMNHAGYGKKLEYDSVIPYLYGKFGVDVVPTKLTVGIEGGVIDLPNHDDTVMFDGLAGISWHLGGSFADGSLEAGYRYLYLKQDIDDFNGVKTTVKGPYLGLNFEF